MLGSTSVLPLACFPVSLQKLISALFHRALRAYDAAGAASYIALRALWAFPCFVRFVLVSFTAPLGQALRLTRAEWASYKGPPWCPHMRHFSFILSSFTLSEPKP